MSERTKLLLAIGAVVVVIAIIALGFARAWTPAIPAGAAMSPVTQTVASSGAGGQQCLDRITNATGHLDLCWEFWPEQHVNAEKDFYTLRVYGSVSGSGSGVRWWVLRSAFVGEPADEALQFWPDATYDGPCAQQTVPISDSSNHQAAEICGRTTGSHAMDGSYSVRWTCVGCILPDHSDREVALYSFVGVPQGTVPTWTIGADFGS